MGIMLSYIARQALYDRDKNIFAYEILHREDNINSYPFNIASNVATQKVIINTFFNKNLSEISSGKTVWLNFDNEMLSDKILCLIPRDKVVIEILETVQPSDRVLKFIIKYSNLGYTFALDDYVHDNRWLSAIPYIKHIKIDLMQTDMIRALEIIKIVKSVNPKIKILAEKVELKTDVDKILKDFDYIQGFCLHKPEIISSKIDSIFCNEGIVSIYEDLNLDEKNYNDSKIIEKMLKNKFFMSNLDYFIKNVLFNCNKDEYDKNIIAHINYSSIRYMCELFFEYKKNQIF
jgi:c-di-GMP-related signal transduction protein